MFSSATPIATSNEAQARAWDGETGSLWASCANSFDLTMSRYQPLFMKACRIQPDSRVLDIGCGTGQATRAAAEIAVDGGAFGIDLSREMIGVARAAAAAMKLMNASFEQGDAQVFPFAHEAFDRAISRTGAMFFGEPRSAFWNIERALTPGGLLTLLTWQAPERNEWIGAIRSAALGPGAGPPPTDGPGPFSMSEPKAVETLLGRSGFDNVSVRPVSEPVLFGMTVDEAYRFALGLFASALADHDEETRERRCRALHATMTEHLTADGVVFGSAGWLITAERTR